MNKFRKNLKFLINVLGPEKKAAFIVLGIILFSAFVECFGISLILPILQVVTYGEIQGKFSSFLTPFISLFPQKHTLVILSVLFLAVITVKCFATIMRIIISKKFVWQLRLQWISRIFEKYMRSEYMFILNHKQGELLNNLVSETQMAALCFSQIIDFVAKLILVIALVATSLLINWQITIILLVVIGSLLLLTYHISHKFAQRIGKRRLSLRQRLSAWAAESISAVRQIKTFGLEEYFTRQNENISRKLRDVQIKFDVIRQLYSPLSELLLACFIVSVIIYTRAFSPASLESLLPIIGVFIMIGLRLTSNISTLAGARIQIVALMPSVILSHSLSSSEVPEEDFSKGQEFRKLQEDIEFDNVSFSYEGEKTVKVFNNLNLTVLYGKMTAIIGPSGIGKSTFADLLLRLYSPQKGRILVNGKDLRKWNLASWRRHLGFVSQDTFIFNTTIRENICFGDQSVTKEKIIEAAKKALAHDFIMEMPQDYDTIVGDRGLKLSGGQRQRIAIARAIVRDPDFLIFDEATSALDHKSEQIVQEAIESLGKEKTILVIAHRLSTIKKAEVVYDLETIMQA